MKARLALDARELAVDLSRPVELAIPLDELADGACLLELQAPALGGDAVPSRPLLFRLAGAAS